MPINKSRLFKDIFNRNAYLYSIKLPFKEPIENTLDNVLTTMTLPTFSAISPLISSFSLNVDDLTRVRDYDTMVNTSSQQVREATEEKKSLFEGSYTGGQAGEEFKHMDRSKTFARNQYRNANVFFLPDEILRYNLMYIISVEHDRFSANDESWGMTWFRGSMLELVPAVVDTIAYSGLIGSMGLNEMWEFISPNKIKLQHLWEAILIKAAFEHRNLSGIGMDQYIQLSTLFNYDVRVFIYHLLNSYDGTINSAYGTINLKIDMLANAETERAEYVKQLNDQLASSTTDWVSFL